ncbi:MAG: zinc-ribbon domain-containing protein [Lachnospiraceae bacterium]|nr:zinc-ribbon domain-containing protein [Lachnospiraceae bacterium]
MLRCPKCGKKYPDGANFCEDCGKRLIPVQQRPPQQKNPGKPSKNSSTKNILIGIIILVVMITVATCIFILSKPKNTEKGSVSSDSETSVKSASVTSESTTVTPAPTRKPISDNTEDQKVSASDITISRVDKRPADLNGYEKAQVSSAGETSAIVQEGYNNKAEVTVDGKDETSWQEGVSGDGIGERIWFNLDRPYEIKYLSFKLGNWRDENNYIVNNRPSKLKITVGDVVATVEYPDVQEEFYVALSQPYSASLVDIRIEGVYKGTQWDDTCIAEVGIYGK